MGGISNEVVQIKGIADSSGHEINSIGIIADSVLVKVAVSRFLQSNAFRESVDGIALKRVVLGVNTATGCTDINADRIVDGIPLPTHVIDHCVIVCGRKIDSTPGGSITGIRDSVVANSVPSSAGIYVDSIGFAVALVVDDGTIAA